MRTEKDAPRQQPSPSRCRSRPTPLPGDRSGWPYPIPPPSATAGRAWRDAVRKGVGGVLIARDNYAGDPAALWALTRCGVPPARWGVDPPNECLGLQRIPGGEGSPAREYLFPSRPDGPQLGTTSPPSTLSPGSFLCQKTPWWVGPGWTPPAPSSRRARQPPKGGPRASSAPGCSAEAVSHPGHR